MAEAIRMTLGEAVAAASGQVDEARITATTEEDIRRHMIEDGEDPDAPLAAVQPVPDMEAEDLALPTRPKAHARGAIPRSTAPAARRTPRRQG